MRAADHQRRLQVQPIEHAHRTFTVEARPRGDLAQAARLPPQSLPPPRPACRRAPALRASIPARRGRPRGRRSRAAGRSRAPRNASSHSSGPSLASWRVSSLRAAPAPGGRSRAGSTCSTRRSLSSSASSCSSGSTQCNASSAGKTVNGMHPVVVLQVQQQRAPVAHRGGQHLQRLEAVGAAVRRVEALQVLQQRGVQRREPGRAGIDFDLVRCVVQLATEVAQQHQLGALEGQCRFEHGGLDGAVAGPARIGTGKRPPRLVSGVTGCSAFLTRHRLRARSRQRPHSPETPMKRRFHQLDVFTAVPLQGNPLAVVHAAAGPVRGDDGRLRALDQPVGDHLPAAAHRCRRRLPRAHLHARAASCPSPATPRWAAATPGWPPAACRATPAWWCRSAASAWCACGASGGRLAFAAPPLRRSGPLDEPLLQRIVAALGLTRRDVLHHHWVDNGPGWCAVMLHSAAQVLACRPDAALLGDAEARHRRQAPGRARGACSRCAPSCRRWASPEDPVTGSLNAGLAQWLIGAGLAPPALRGGAGRGAGPCRARARRTARRHGVGRRRRRRLHRGHGGAVTLPRRPPRGGRGAAGAGRGLVRGHARRDARARAAGTRCSAPTTGC